MALYMIQASYTAEALAALTKNPVDRTPGVRTVMEKLGGTLHHLFYSLGEYDIMGLAELPDDIAASAAAMAIIAPGHLRTFKTTKLLTVHEAMEAMQKAGTVGYRAPAS